MKPVLLPTLALLSFTTLNAADDTPVPPEIQSLAETLVTALKSGDDTALLTCWHSPETLAKLAQTQDPADAPSPEQLIKIQNRELRNKQRNQTVTLYRASQIRDHVTKHFGDLAALKLTQIELDIDDDAPADQPAFDDVDLFLTCADGTLLTFSIDDAIQLDGIWKFKDRIEDRLSIVLTDTPD